MKRKFLVSTVLCLASFAVTYGQLNIAYEKYTMPNGLDVILHEDHSTPVISVNIMYHVGGAREKTGRTGFAHLFEHLMYEGSQHVRDGLYDEIIDGSGGSNNGSTGFDMTRYWVVVPKNYIEPALWLESDRMGFLLPGITQDRLDLQRDVVKNERRENYENRPYGMAFVKLFEALYPQGIPYHWLPIGSQEDLTAASLEDVKEFFRTWYIPGNASLCIGGDFDPAEMKPLVRKYFGDIPGGAPVPKPIPMRREMKEVKKIVLEDKVQLPRLYMVWHSPATFAEGDAEMDLLAQVLSDGKNSRLYKDLVYEKKIAQDVSAFQGGNELSGYFGVVATAKPGVTLEILRTEIEAALKRLVDQGPDERELQRAKNGVRSNFIYSLQSVGGFNGKTDQLNSYNILLGDPGKFNEDLKRYERVSPEAIQKTAATYLRNTGHVILSIVPAGKLELQVQP